VIIKKSFLLNNLYLNKEAQPRVGCRRKYWFQQFIGGSWKSLRV